MAGEMKRIREVRGVPCRRGGRVRYTGEPIPREGTIKSAKRGYLNILLDGDQHPGLYHPTWKLEYL
jgi:hypothetical protein